MDKAKYNSNMPGNLPGIFLTAGLVRPGPAQNSHPIEELV